LTAPMTRTDILGAWSLEELVGLLGCGMKIAKTIAIVLIGPLFGMLVAIILAGFALPPDPNFATNGGHGSPGDGFLIILYIFVSLVVSVPLSLLLAGIFWFRSGPSRKSPPLAEGLSD
jgi:hypothetical protein